MCIRDRLSVLINVVAIPVAIATDAPETAILVQALIQTLVNFYGLFFILGLLTAITEWDQIHCVWYKKVLYLFTFPVFMLSYRCV